MQDEQHTQPQSEDASLSTSGSVPPATPSAQSVAEAFAEFEHAHPHQPLQPDPVAPPLPLPQVDLGRVPGAEVIAEPLQAAPLPIPKKPEISSIPPIPAKPPADLTSKQGVEEAAAKQIDLVIPEKPRAPAPGESLLAQAAAAMLPQKPGAFVPKPPVSTLIEETVPQEPSQQEQNAAPTRNVPRGPKVPVIETLRAQASLTTHPLRTLRTDVEESVKEHKTSIISVAAAEENRRAFGVTSAPLLDADLPQKKSRFSWLAILVSMLLLIGGAGVVVYVFVPETAPPAPPGLPASHLMYVDEVAQISLIGASHPGAMQNLVALRDNTNLSLGLIRELYPTVSGTTTAESLARANAQELLAILAPNAPEEFVRTLLPAYVLGIHVFDGNQAFLLLKTNSYEQAYAGMIAWEPSINTDLLPLFERRPRPRLETERLSTSTAPSILNSKFSDAVIENHDARVLKDDKGNIVLLWTFVDRATIIITTNENTLRELITRIKSAPVQGL